MIKKENFISSVGANTQPGYVEQMIAQHNEDFASHGAHFHEVAEDLNVHEQKDMHLQEGEREKWDLAAETVSKIPDEVKKDADRAEVSADNASVSELTANAAAAAAKMAKEHAAFYRDRAEKYAADSQAAAGIAVNAKTAAEQAYGNTLNMAGQMSIEHNEMRTAFENLENAYESFETNFDKKADKQTEGGGFVGGLGAVSADSSSAVGKGAQAKNGGFAGGSGTFANAGFAGGMSAKVHFYGGAAGRNAIAGAGFSGGDGAIAGKKANEADRVNCIQLGAGVNNVEGSLQVYGFQLMDGNGKIPQERLPELEKHFVLRGTVSDLDSLPDSKNVGDVYIVESERQFSKPCAQVVGGMELFSEDSPGNRYYQLSDVFASSYSEFISTDTAYLYNPDGSLWGPIFYNAPAAGQRLEGLNGYNTKFEPDSSFRFYVCKERGLKMNGGLYVWNGLCWDRISPEFFLEDLEKKADADSVYTKTEADALVSGKLEVKGEVNTFSDLPESAGEGDIYRLKTGGIFSNSAHSELLVGSFDEYFDDIYGDGSVYNFQNGIDNHPELSEYFTNPDSPVAYIYTASHEYLCDTTYNQPGGYSKDFYAPIMTGDNTVAFYISPFQSVRFYTVAKQGLVFRHEDKWYPVSDVSNFYTQEEIDGKIDNVSLWGGEVSNGNDLPANPVPGMFCYVSSGMASNGVKYTGRCGDLFSCDGGDLWSYGLMFTAPDKCIYTDPELTVNAQTACIYKDDGTYAGKIYINASEMPPAFNASILGASSADDVITFYLGIHDNGVFPETVSDYNFSAGSMIFWDGAKWCGVASSDAVGDIESALDGILSIQAGLIDGGSV